MRIAELVDRLAGRLETMLSAEPTSGAEAGPDASCTPVPAPLLSGARQRAPYGGGPQRTAFDKLLGRTFKLRTLRADVPGPAEGAHERILERARRAQPRP